MVFNWTDLGTPFTDISIVSSGWTLPLIMIVIAVAILMTRDRTGSTDATLFIGLVVMGIGIASMFMESLIFGIGVVILLQIIGVLMFVKKIRSKD